MFELSFWETVIIAVVAILVVGPERLPSLAYKVGQWVTKVRRFIANARAEIENELNTAELRKLLSAQEEEIQRLRRLMEDTRQEVEQEGKRLTEALKHAAGTSTDSSKPVPVSQDIPPVPRTLEDEIQVLSQELGETLHRPSFGGDTTPSASGTKQA